MVANPVSLTCKTPLLYRFVGSSLKPISQFGQQIRVPVKPVRISIFRGCSSRFLNFCHGTGFESLGTSKMGFGQLGFDRLRFSAATEGVTGGPGSGGSGGGGFGGSGDGNSSSGAGDGDGDGGSNWSFFSGYLALLAKYPVSTKAVTSALLTLIGDLICQLWIDQAGTLDLKRTFLFTLLGLVLVGPTLHFWYLYLSKLVTLPGASGAFLRLLLDQFIFSPIFIGVFLSTLLTLEGRPGQVVAKLEQEWFSSVLANWQLWIPFQFLNFRFVPQQFQVLAANVVALVWNVILSFKAHKEVLPK
ncbi:protein Mpv17 [Mangifera indica]|uniref:protein Mpv17 n=1 Tax=Mangifera indica TaxID=29780 RepID=UPI001CF98C58|nr:protein Mpv17 [Mangifera indica]